MGKVLLANIKGPKGDPGSEFKILSSFYGTVDPTGAVTSDSAIANWVDDCATSQIPGFAPPGTYKIAAQMNWQIPGLQLKGSGSQFTKFRQSTANTGVVAVAGQAQDISGMDFGYSSQEAAANTASIGMSLGDDTVGSSFMSRFTDLLFTQCQRGMAVNPALTTKAGLFSCHFDTIRALGYSYSAIHLIGDNGTGGANATGCVFDNIYVHNNFSGSDANSTWWPVYLQAWDEVTFNQLNVEHAQVFNSEPVGFVSVGNAVVNGLHLEHLELSGNPGWGHIYASHATSVEVNGLSIRFPTMTGTSYNSIVRLNGTEGPKVTIAGLNEPLDGSSTYATVHPLVDFNSCTNGKVKIKPISVSQHTKAAINAGSGCSVEYDGGWDPYPAPRHAPTGTLAETFPRELATSSSTGSSGKAYGRVISLRAGQKVSTLTMWTAGAVKTAGTHGWYALLDPATFKVLAVTADQTDTATKWGTASTKYGLAVGTAITVPNDGDYIFAWSTAISGGVMPSFDALATTDTAANQEPPILAGVIDNSGTLTTPPAVGAVMGSGTWFVQNAGFNVYATVS